MRVASIVCALVFLSACATVERLPNERERLTRQIADDAAAFNEAYGQAVSAQILLNILRGKDRLPRYYLAMTGIADSPSWRLRQNLNAGAIPLGEGASPWGVGNIGLERETQTRPSYAVQPFNAETLTRTAFEPTAPHVFEHYWRSGWPRDLLLLVMVEAIETTDASNTSMIFTNEANTIFDDCPSSVQTNGCDFVRALRSVLSATAGAPAQSGAGMRHARQVCGLVEAYAPAAPVQPAEPEQGQVCDPVFAIGPALVRLRLRSLDDMIYYVGELLRAGGMNAGVGDAIEAEVTIGAAGLRGGGRGVPLFRVTPRAAWNDGYYAAEVEYRGVRYAAGPAVSRSCGEAAEAGACRDAAAEGDRSSSVLSLLAELMALNQSPDSIRAPSRLIAE